MVGLVWHELYPPMSWPTVEHPIQYVIRRMPDDLLPGPSEQEIRRRLIKVRNLIDDYEARDSGPLVLSENDSTSCPREGRA